MNRPDTGGRRPAVTALALLAGGIALVAAAAAPAQSPATRGIAPIRGTDGVAPAQAVAHRITTRLDSGFRTPEVTVRYGGYLTAKSSASPGSIARAFLLDRHTQYGLRAEDVASLRIVRSYRTKHNGATHVFLAPTDRGRVVYGSRLGFLIDREGRIVTVTGRLATDTTATGTPALDPRGAVLLAARHAGVRHKSWLEALEVRWNRGRFVNTLAHGVTRPSDLTAELVTFPMPAGTPARLAWKTVTELDRNQWYESIVDARTGELLYRRNLYAHAQGRVFTGQHPTASGGVRTLVGFPASWHSASAATSGPLTNAYQDLTNSNTVEYQTTTPAAPDPNFQNYDFPFTDLWNTNGVSASLVPAGTGGYADIDAVLTQLFYYTNVMHDYLLGFGFDVASGNFEGDDPVNAEATDGWEDGVAANCPDGPDPGSDPDQCVNNANFGTPADGSSPRMQMYMWTSPWRDGSLDGDVIAHEYGHGLSSRLVGGGDLGSGIQTGALGEGWSDFVSVSKWDDNTVGEYVTGNTATGIRPWAFDASPAVYSMLCTINSIGCQVHSDGQIWVATLYDMRTALVARYGNSGKDGAMQLVVDGMKATPTSPDYLDARDGILAADVATNAGANQCLIWGAFAGREMGFSSTTSGSNDMNPDVATDGPAACTPTADLGGPYATIEGTDASLDGSGSLNPGDPGTGPLTYEWDLDDDGQFDDATGVSPSFELVGQDGVYPIHLRVTNEFGFTDTDSGAVAVANVPPTVTIANNGPKLENTAVTVSGVVSDAGWLEDPLTATIDWGDGSGAVALSGVVESVRPFKTITYSEDHVYGDDGLFTVTVCAADDDTTDNCTSTDVVVLNVDPGAEIDLAGAVLVNGVPTFVAHEGELIPFSASSFDPGSDDRTTTWDWGDGLPSPDTTKLSLNDPAFDPDPDPSPSISPRTVTDDEPHAFADACLYEVVFEAHDDDAGSASDSVAVVIAGNESKDRAAGYWQTQYRPRPTALPEARRLCYLAIVGFMSTVFDEVRDASTVAAAFDVLRVDDNGGDESQRLDRELLTAWLNFANGAFDLDELVDTDGGGPDTAFAVVMATAEAVRTNPTATTAQMREQRTILQRING